MLAWEKVWRQLTSDMIPHPPPSRGLSTARTVMTRTYINDANEAEREEQADRIRDRFRDRARGG